MKPLEELKDFHENCFPTGETEPNQDDLPDELIPSEAVDMGNEFRLKHGNDLS